MILARQIRRDLLDHTFHDGIACRIDHQQLVVTLGPMGGTSWSMVMSDTRLPARRTIATRS